MWEKCVVHKFHTPSLETTQLHKQKMFSWYSGTESEILFLYFSPGLLPAVVTCSVSAVPADFLLEAKFHKFEI